MINRHSAPLGAGGGICDVSRLPELLRRIFMRTVFSRIALICLLAGLCAIIAPKELFAQTYADNQTLYSNQDLLTETRRSTHFRLCFGHYDRDGAGLHNEAYVQGNLQMYGTCGTAGSPRWGCMISTHPPRTQRWVSARPTSTSL